MRWPYLNSRVIAAGAKSAVLTGARPGFTIRIGVGMANDFAGYAMPTSYSPVVLDIETDIEMDMEMDIEADVDVRSRLESPQHD